MIVPFALDPDALALPDGSDPARFQAHERLLDRWGHLGVLVHVGERAVDSEVAAAVAALPQKARKLWQGALQRFRTRTGPPGWRGLHLAETFDDFATLGDAARLACLEEARAMCVGLPDEEISCRAPSGDLEIVRFDCADRARAFVDAEALAERDIEEGERVRDVWATRFATLAELSRNVVVVDRYAAVNHYERDDGKSGLRKFLVELAGIRGPRGVTVYSSIKTPRSNPPGPIEDVLSAQVQQLVTGLRRENLRRFDLHLIDDRDFARLAHDRYVRFDDAVCDIGSGIDVLTGNNVFRRTSFSLHGAALTRKQAEASLVGLARLSWNWKPPT